MNASVHHGDRLHELLIRWQDDELSAGETEALIQMLHESQAARKNLVAQAVLDAGISRGLKNMEIWRASLSPAKKMSAWNWQRLGLPLAAAAALVLGVYGVNVYQARQSGKAVMGYVVDVNGMAARIQNGAQLRDGDMIGIGDAVRVGADGYVKFAYADGSEIELLKNTKLTLGASRETRLLGLVRWCGAKEIQLDAGRLVAQVAKQKPGQSMILTTSHAQVTVVGTSLSLEEKKDCSRLAVVDGVARLAELTGGREIEVSGGYSAEAGPGLELKRTKSARVEDGLLALYVFDEGKGAILHDVSGVGEPVDLVIKRPQTTTWLPNGIHMRGAAKMERRADTSDKISEALRVSTNLTFEFWLRGNMDVSDSTRTFAENAPGLLTHVVESDEGGTLTIYHNGESRPSSMRIFHHVNANPFFMRFFYMDASDSRRTSAENAPGMETRKGNKFWTGDCYMVAIYNRAFTTADVRRDYEAGLAGIAPYRKADLGMGGRKPNETMQ